MSSYGVEVELDRPIYFLISKVICSSKAHSEDLIFDFPQNQPLQIGPARDQENDALCHLIRIILNQISASHHRHFAQIQKTATAQTNSTRLNRSVITFPSQKTPFEFVHAKPSELQFLMKHIQFSTDHGGNTIPIMIPEIITLPVGRYPYHSDTIFQNQTWFLNLFFTFCDQLIKTKHYQIPCSIHWHDPSTWQEKDQNNALWDYDITLQGLCVLPSPSTIVFGENPTSIRNSLYPQYNFSIDLTHFLLIDHHRPIPLLPDQDDESSAQDPISYLYDLSLRGVEKAHGSLNPVCYQATLLELSRQIVHQMSHMSDSWERYKEPVRYWIDGAFGFTIWYFLSLCLGETDAYLYKNLFLFMPKTSPIPFLKAAYNSNPEYYDRLVVNFLPAFLTVLPKIFQPKYNNTICPFLPGASAYIKERFIVALKMNRFFPRIAQWYDGLNSKFQIAPSTLELDQFWLEYSNPLPAQLSKDIHDLHQTVLFLCGNHTATVKTENDREMKNILSALIQFIGLGLMGASTRYNLAITQHDPRLNDAMIQIGKLLAAPATTRLPVYAQPGFGRPKLETRLSDIPDPSETNILIDRLNALGRPRFTLPAVTVPKTRLDQQSVDLSVTLGDAKHVHTDQPWQTTDDQFVWIPGKQEFGRRKEEDIKRWLEKLPPTATSKHIVSATSVPSHPTLPEKPPTPTAPSDFSVHMILQANEAQLATIINMIISP